MAAKRTSLYLTAQSIEVINPCTSLSGRINTIIARYQQMISQATPALTITQWELLCATLADTPNEERSAQYLWADIAAAGDNQLAEQIREMPSASHYAILDIVNRYRHHQQNNPDATPAAALATVGAKIK